MIYSLLTTELCLFSSSVLMHKHMHTSIEHTPVHTMSILASMPTLVIPNLEYPADLQPDTDYSSCKHWQLFSDCLHLPQPPSPLNSYQTHGWDIPWLVAWSEFLHRSVFNWPWPRRTSSTWPFLPWWPHHPPLSLHCVQFVSVRWAFFLSSNSPFLLVPQSHALATLFLQLLACLATCFHRSLSHTSLPDHLS